MSERTPRFIRTTASASLAAAFLLLTGMTFHHGWNNYHQDIELTYVGVIKTNDIGNPHTYIDLQVSDRRSTDDRAGAYDGVQEWNVVLAPVSRMRSRGMDRDALLDVGSTVTVVGYPHRSVEREMRAERIIIGDLTIELR